MHQLPVSNEFKHFVINFDFCHIHDVFGQEHPPYCFRVMVSGEEVCYSIVTRRDPDHDWLELKGTHMEEEFSQTILQLLV